MAERGREEIITVAELDRRLRRAVERVTGREWVEGEVTSLRRAGSGHVYFCLRDEREDAAVDCVMYRYPAQRARRHLFDGARIQLFGRATVWAPRGRLQLIAETARPAGRGALLAALEALKERLATEGLFAPERKRALPSEPKVIGVVTSVHGAALHDVVTVAHRRGNVRIIVSPALVQGEGAPSSILSALDLLEQYPGLDVLIIGRGGGSGEDLMAFNDERVVRRVSAMAVPVVSAVGHEIDTTLTDLVADVRAATPSQAAELVVPDLLARAESLLRARLHLARAMRSRLLEDRMVIDRLCRKLGDPRFPIAEKQQYVDELRLRLERRIIRSLASRRMRYERLYPRLMSRHPRSVVARARARLVPLSSRLRAAAKTRLATSNARLVEAQKQLHALSPLRVLSRGYAIATRSDGRALRRWTDVGAGEEIDVRLHEGRVTASVVRTRKERS